MSFIGVVLDPFLRVFFRSGDEKAWCRALKSRICDLCSVAFEGFLSLQRMQVASGPSIISIIPPLIFMEMASICKRLVVRHHINYLRSLWLDCLVSIIINDNQIATMWYKFDMGEITSRSHTRQRRKSSSIFSSSKQQKFKASTETWNYLFGGASIRSNITAFP